MIGKLLIAAALTLPLLATGSVAHAEAQEVDAATSHVAGLVTGEHGNVLEVRARRGQVDVHWSDETACAVNGDAVGCERIAPGMALVAWGAFAGDSNQFRAKTIHARAAVDTIDRVHGVIQAEEGQTLAVQTRDGTVVRVHWTDETLCRTRDERFDCERLAPRHRIVAVGRMTDAGFQARMIGLVPGDHADLARVHGIVTADHGRVLQVETRDGTVQVRWDGETVCQAPRGRIDCEAIGERDRVLAVGEWRDDRSLHATRIIVRSPRTDAPTLDARPVREAVALAAQ